MTNGSLISAVRACSLTKHHLLTTIAELALANRSFPYFILKHDGVSAIFQKPYCDVQHDLRFRAILQHFRISMFSRLK